MAMTSPGQTTLRRTPLYECHLAAGARMVDFAGWEMPLQYEGVVSEHVAVREGCGIFDVSHMGQIETSGPQALALLQRLLSNDVAAIAFSATAAAAAAAPGGPGTGGAQYALLCEEDGGVLDDLITYRLDAERYLTVTNAANHAGDLEQFRRVASQFPGARVSDRIEDWAMLAVQGPLAREVVQAISDAPLPARMRVSTRRLAAAEALVCGTGYTGEEGVELLCAPEQAAALWEELVRRGARPAGLGARDTLRLEACFPLYGNELSRERNPIEAGLGWACREQTAFIGSEAVRAARERGTRERLAAFAIEGRGIARRGNAIVGGGEVSSGTLSPCLKVGVGMAYVPAERSAPGTRLEIDVRGKMRAAVVKEKPLYRKAA